MNKLNVNFRIFSIAFSLEEAFACANFSFSWMAKRHFILSFITWKLLLVDFVFGQSSSTRCYIDSRINVMNFSSTNYCLLLVASDDDDDVGKLMYI